MISTGTSNLRRILSTPKTSRKQPLCRRSDHWVAHCCQPQRQRITTEQGSSQPYFHCYRDAVMWKPKPHRNTGCPFALGLIVDGTIRTKQGRLISVRDQPPSPPCFNTPPTTLATKTTRETSNRPSKPTFTRQLIEHKLHTLKMRYKRITQRRAKLMRAIRKTHRQKVDSP